MILINTGENLNRQSLLFLCLSILFCWEILQFFDFLFIHGFLIGKKRFASLFLKFYPHYRFYSVFLSFLSYEDFSPCFHYCFLRKSQTHIEFCHSVTCVVDFDTILDIFFLFYVDLILLHNIMTKKIYFMKLFCQRFPFLILYITFFFFLIVIWFSFFYRSIFHILLERKTIEAFYFFASLSPFFLFNITTVYYLQILQIFTMNDNGKLICALW